MNNTNSMASTTTTATSAKNARAASMSATNSNATDRREKLRQRMRDFYGLALPENNNSNSVNARAVSEPMGVLHGTTQPMALLIHPEKSQTSLISGSNTTNNNLTSVNNTIRINPEMDLDSEYFNVSKYTTELLKNQTLQGLVAADTSLLRNVKKLDHELQELVYRNYAKFISATDTIREMKDSVSEMDNKLLALSSTVEVIDGLSHSVNEQLGGHRAKIENSLQHTRMLKKIQFLVHLPHTMKQLMESNQFHMAVKHWVIGDHFLMQHNAIPSIARIQQACTQEALQLYSAIEEAMCSTSLDDPEAMEQVRGYVEDLRLLRATSLFTAITNNNNLKNDDLKARPLTIRAAEESNELSNNGNETDDFELGILRVLMNRVTDNFTHSVASVNRELNRAFTLTQTTFVKHTIKDKSNVLQVEKPTTSSYSLEKEEEEEEEPLWLQLLVDLPLREILAQLKSSCALLAVNTERVYALLNMLDDRTTRNEYNKNNNNDDDDDMDDEMNELEYGETHKIELERSEEDEMYRQEMMKSANEIDSVHHNTNHSITTSKKDRINYNRPVQRVLANNVAIQVAAAVQPVLIDLLPQLITLFNEFITSILNQLIEHTSFHLNDFNKRKSKNKNKSELISKETNMNKDDKQKEIEQEQEQEEELEEEEDKEENEDDEDETKNTDVNVNERSTGQSYKKRNLQYNSLTQACISILMQHLKYLSITLKTLGVNYLDTIHGAHSAAYGIMVDDTINSILQGLLNNLQQQVYVCFAEHEMKCVTNFNNEEEEENEENSTTKNVLLKRREYLQFVLSRFACVGLAGYVWEHMVRMSSSYSIFAKYISAQTHSEVTIGKNKNKSSSGGGGDSIISKNVNISNISFSVEDKNIMIVSVEAADRLLRRTEELISALIHRSIILWGYYSFICTFASSFSIYTHEQNQISGNNDGNKEEEEDRVTVPTELLTLLSEWNKMLKVLKRILPSTLKRITPVRAYIASSLAPQFVGHYTYQTENNENNNENNSEKEQNDRIANKSIDSTRRNVSQVKQLEVVQNTSTELTASSVSNNNNNNNITSRFNTSSVLSPFERGRSTTLETRASRVPSHLSMDKASGMNSTSTNNHNVYHYSQRHRLEVNYTRNDEHNSIVIGNNNNNNNFTNTNNVQRHVERIFASPASSSEIALANFNSPTFTQNSRVITHSTFPMNYRLSGIISAMLCYYLQAVLNAIRDTRKLPFSVCTTINRNQNKNTKLDKEEEVENHHHQVKSIKYDHYTFQRLQLCCNALLRFLLATPKNFTYMRQYAREWDRNFTRYVIEVLNDMCALAYERYDAKIPLAGKVMNKRIDEVLYDRVRKVKSNNKNNNSSGVPLSEKGSTIEKVDV